MATATYWGDTGLWFVPTAEVLQAKKWSASLYRTNVDDGQGFTDISTFPVTFAYGLGGSAEIFGSWALITRIDRDTRPLFFESTPASIANGVTQRIGVGDVVIVPAGSAHWFSVVDAPITYLEVRWVAPK